MGILNHENFRVSGEEHFVTRELPRLLAEAQPVVFDVGANQGDYAELVLAVLHVLNFPFGTALSIYAFWVLLNSQSAGLFK